MAKTTRAKTPAAAAAAPDKSEHVEAPVPVAAPEQTATYPYLLPLDAYRAIFGCDSASTPTPTTTADKFRALQQALGVAHCDANPRSAAWIDWCFGVLCFARSRDAIGGFALESDGQSDDQSDESDEKALLVLTIADDVFQFAVTPQALRDLPSVEQCYDRFRDRVREVSCAPPLPAAATDSSSSSTSDEALQEHVEQHEHTAQAAPLPRPPTLSPREVASFVAFMSATFFRHLAAYQYVHTHTRASVTRVLELCVDTPFPPAPLASATLLVEGSDTSVDALTHEQQQDTMMEGTSNDTDTSS